MKDEDLFQQADIMEPADQEVTLEGHQHGKKMDAEEQPNAELNRLK